MSKRRGGSYRGQLLAPIEISYGRDINKLQAAALGPDGFDKLQARQLAEINKWININYDHKLGLLRSHFGIIEDEQVWRNLALALAREHVPGFGLQKDVRSRGAPLKWSSQRREHLKIAVDFLKETENLDTKAACQKLATSPDYADEWGPPETTTPRKWGATLRVKYQDVKKKGV